MLRHAIASVVAQRFTDWELLVIGDACTDDTAAVVEAFRDPRIRFHQLPQNVGEQSGPNNEGVSRARGEAIAFLNHDDLWLPDHLERLVPALARSRADLVFSLMAAIIPGEPPVLSNFTPSGVYEPRTIAPASTWLFTRALADRVGRWRSLPRVLPGPISGLALSRLRAGRQSAARARAHRGGVPVRLSTGELPGQRRCRTRGVVGADRNEPGFREQLLTDLVLGQARDGSFAASSTAGPALPVARREERRARRALGRRHPARVGAVVPLLAEEGGVLSLARRLRGLPELSRTEAMKR